jgi:putative transposase
MSLRNLRVNINKLIFIANSQAAQQILRTVAESFKSYYGLIKAYKSEKITDKPRIPNYRKKNGLATVIVTDERVRTKKVR